MKSYSPLLILFLVCTFSFGQDFKSKYAVFDKKVVLVKRVNKRSELLCVVPKGNPVQIMEKVRGPVYKAQYKNWEGYLISFNLANRLKDRPPNFKRTEEIRKSSKRTYVTLSRKTYITKKTNYKMVLAVPKRQTIEVLERIRKSRYLVRFKNHLGYAELGSFNIQNEMALALLTNMKINRSPDLEAMEVKLPPIIEVNDISLLNNVLHAGKSNQLVITLSNTGGSDANRVYVRLHTENRGIEIPETIHFPEIKANGGVETLRLTIHGNSILEDGVANLNIEIAEPDFRGPLIKRSLRFETAELPKPELVITDYRISEIRPDPSNNRIDQNEMIELTFVIRNMGRASAEELKVEVKSEQQGLVQLGLVKSSDNNQHPAILGTIVPGGYHRMKYRYFVNNDFNEPDLVFRVNGLDRINGSKFKAKLVFPLDLSGGRNDTTELKNNNSSFEYTNNLLQIEREPPIDVDYNIPYNRNKQEHAYALIIGNEDYRSRQKTLAVEQNAKYSVNDALVFANYCHRTLGIPAKQIKILSNATAAEMSQALSWVNNLSKIENGKAKIIFFYSGHGLPDEETESPILVPVDVSANNLKYGIRLSEVFSALIEHPVEQVTVFLDACFSGGGRNQSLQLSKGIKVKANRNVVLGNMVVLSSSSREETSSIYSETKHGYFTYFLLKKLQETKGNIELGELSTFIINSVRKETGLNGIVQTPEVTFSQKVAESWEQWKLK